MPSLFLQQHFSEGKKTPKQTKEYFESIAILRAEVPQIFSSCQFLFPPSVNPSSKSLSILTERQTPPTNQQPLERTSTVKTAIN